MLRTSKWKMKSCLKTTLVVTQTKEQLRQWKFRRQRMNRIQSHRQNKQHTGRWRCQAYQKRWVTRVTMMAPTHSTVQVRSQVRISTLHNRRVHLLLTLKSQSNLNRTTKLRLIKIQATLQLKKASLQRNMKVSSLILKLKVLLDSETVASFYLSSRKKVELQRKTPKRLTTAKMTRKNYKRLIYCSHQSQTSWTRL